MFAITEGTRKVFGAEITTYTRDVVSANLLEVEAGTNGFQGGDAGHGSRAYIRISLSRSRSAASPGTRSTALPRSVN